MRRLLALPSVVAAFAALALVGLPAAAVAAPQGEAVEGGAAPTQATAIEAGTAYSDDIRPGEARWFSLDVDEGQELGSTLTEYGETEYNCCLKIELSDPDFDAIRSDNGTNTTGTAQTLRTETDEDGVDESGTYYLSVELDSDTSTRAVAFDFSVDVAGEGMLTSSASPSGEATSDPSASASAGSEGSSTTSVSAEESGGVSPLLWGVVGVLALLLLVLLGLVAVLLKRLGSSRS